MPFARQLRDLLRVRERLVPAEFAKGEPLESVLERHLLVVESTADFDTVTSILLLDGNTLHHGAGPKLAKSYRDAINGLPIGPKAGSCGTAAFTGRPVYVTDIANDPLWEDYRDLALEQGLRACWSTPIRNSENRLIGTFAIYHQRARNPTKEEVESIRTITDHVARAIMFYRGEHYQSEGPAGEPAPEPPQLKLVSGSNQADAESSEHRGD